MLTSKEFAKLLGVSQSTISRAMNDSDLVRHNPLKLAKAIIALIYRLKLFGKGIRFFDYFFARQTMQELRKHAHKEG